MLSAYTQQPVDELMERFDLVFLANLARCPVRKPPIFEHRCITILPFRFSKRRQEHFI